MISPEEGGIRSGSGDPQSTLERLLNSGADGILSAQEEATLAELLRSDPEARRQYLRLMHLHAQLHWEHGAAAALLSESPAASDAAAVPLTRPSDFRSGHRTWIVLALFATTAGLLLMAFLPRTREHGPMEVSSPVVVTVESIHGVVMFRDSETDRLLAVGEPLSLPAGTLVLEGDTAALQCRFFDGSMITLTGDAEAKFADADQKRVRLSRGELTAEVTPQPAGRPMIIETPTARVEVLGTVLTLSAEADRTSVRVDSGSVRLSRLVDGRAVEIDYDHACIASLDPREDLQPLPTGGATGVWWHGFAEPPPARWKGKWLASSGGEPNRVRAVACIAGRKNEAQPIIHFGVSARRVDGIDLGRLPADATLRIKCRLSEPAPLRIMLGVNRPDGRFGGNFETKLSARSVVADHGRWQWLEIPLSRLKPLVPKFPAMAEGDRPYLILITTFEEDAGLEVAELSIIEHEGRHP